MFWLEKKEISDFATHLEYRAYCKKRLLQITNWEYRQKKNNVV